MPPKMLNAPNAPVPVPADTTRAGGSQDDTIKPGRRESLISILRHPTQEPIFLLPRAWSNIHLDLLRFTFLPPTTAPVSTEDDVFIGPLTQDQIYASRFVPISGYIGIRGTISDLLMGVLRYTRDHERTRRLHIYIHEWEFLLYIDVDTNHYDVGSSPVAFRLPGDRHIGLISTDYLPLVDMRSSITEAYWNRLRRKVRPRHKLLTVPMSIAYKNNRKFRHVLYQPDPGEDPFIAALLIAVAQARRAINRPTLVCQVLLHNSLTCVHLYTAAIPRALLRWLDPPPESGSGTELADWPTIEIARLDITFNPRYSFYRRLDHAIRSERARHGETFRPPRSQ